MAAPIIELNGRWGGKLRSQDLDITSGDDLTLEVTTLNTDDSVKDMTSGTVKWVLAHLPGSEPIITITGSLTDAANGVSQVAVTGTGNYDGWFYHELQFTESGGSIGTIMRGTIKLSRDSA